MLTRTLQRAARWAHRSASHASPAAAAAGSAPHPSLTRCMASPSAPSPPPPPPSSSTGGEDDAGADFVQDDVPDASWGGGRGLPQQESLSQASGSFTRQQQPGLNILAPRTRGGAGSGRPQSRADDPASANLLRQMQQTEVVSAADPSVPVGSGQGSSRPLPRKGGRPIHPADVIEQRGQLTPIQLHRVLSTTKLEAGSGESGDAPRPAAHWTDERVARAYSLSEGAVANIRQHLSLPYVFPADNEQLWRGGSEVPVHVQLQRSLGHAAPILFLGQHLGIEKPKEGGEQGGKGGQ